MSKLLTIVLVTLFLTITTAFAQDGVQSGKFAINTSTANYNLHKNSGDRSVTIEINFTKPFEIKPTVVLSVTQLDADKDTNVRYGVDASSVSRDGFTIKVSTWADSKIYGLGGQWIAHVE
ncbi:MAG: H-type lectin domain-containing protein [Ignavibacteriaceae bacterium]